MKKFFDRAMSLIKTHKIIVASIAAIIVVVGVVLCFVFTGAHRDNNEAAKQTEPPATTPAPTSHTHFYVEEEVEATCGHGGRTLYTCDCGHSYVENETPALDHELGEWVLILEATTDHDGQMERYCLHCNFRITETLPMLEPHEHTFKDKVTAATCTKAGSTLRTCTVCGYKTTIQGAAALDHTWSNWSNTGNENPAGFIEISRTCSTCGKVEIDEMPQKPEAHNHSFKETVVEPTCTEDGYTLRQCGCGEAYKTNETSKRGHLYDAWVTTKKPTTAETGERQCVCSRCGHINKEIVAKLDASTANKYEHIDSRIEIKTNGSGAVLYSYYPVSVVDARTWGDPPTIHINSAGGFDITYYKQDGTKVSYKLNPVDGYVNQFVILKDGTYGTQLFGDYKD